MIPNLAYTSRDLYASNQVRSRPIYLPFGLSATGLHIKGLHHFVNALTDEAVVRTREKSQVCPTSLSSLPSPKVLESDTRHNLTSRRSASKLTTWIIYSLDGSNTLSYICTSIIAIYHKLMVLLIQCSLIEKIHSKGWLPRLTKKIR